MRSALLGGLVCGGLIWLAAVGLASAQYNDPTAGGQAHLNQTPSPSSNRNGHDSATPPPPPPIPRCADLAVTSLGFAAAIPGAAPLTGDEVALQYDVHNAGTAMYVAPSGAAQSLSLEYTTPGGPHEVATLQLPPPVAGVTAAAAQNVTLAQGQSWRGYMRMTLPAVARRWPLRLKLNFAQSSSPYAARISDCDPGNDEVPVPRP